MVRSIADVLALRVEPVHLLLQRRVRLRVREEAVEDARDRAGARVGSRHHRESAVVEEMALGGRVFPRKVFVVLFVPNRETLVTCRWDAARTK